MVERFDWEELARRLLLVLCAKPAQPVSLQYETRERVSNKLITNKIQATDKSFADTRERAQKLIEEEKSRGTKDVTKHRQKGSLLKSGTPRVGSASSSRNVSPLLTRTLDTPSSRISPNKFANSTGSNGNASSQNNGSSGTPRATPTQHLNSELRKKKLRQRIIQLVVLGKFSGADLILRQLRKDGLNEEAGIERRVEDIVREVSEPSNSGGNAVVVVQPRGEGLCQTCNTGFIFIADEK
ncbi:hypothetical protein ANCCAN_04864 [Ancylostoma caninum]|uniref:RNA polymerase II elongation factor ELL N-terminal domain-containing protein n=1 Tax=Ancylostoma caninum TaxID=29170 RepID=A0A368H0J0_ANCCA|nr:hypothetical protein ANCCAN_04864 [Ancylostoma caninum]